VKSLWLKLRNLEEPNQGNPDGGASSISGNFTIYGYQPVDLRGFMLSIAWAWAGARRN